MRNTLIRIQRKLSGFIEMNPRGKRGYMTIANATNIEMAKLKNLFYEGFLIEINNEQDEEYVYDSLISICKFFTLNKQAVKFVKSLVKALHIAKQKQHSTEMMAFLRQIERTYKDFNKNEGCVTSDEIRNFIISLKTQTKKAKAIFENKIKVL